MRQVNRRRRYFIDTRFQLKFIGLILLVVFGVAIFSSLTIYYYTWMLLGEKLANVYPQGRLVGILRTANVILLVRIVLLSPLVVVLAIFLSHRIAGPIYRIKKTLEEVAAGNYRARLRLRKTDELQDVAEAVNKVIEILDLQERTKGR